MRLSEQQRISLTILVAALGYFVDVFDLQLFAMVRVVSLKSLGLAPDQITTVGAYLLNWQMAGMLLGGILWGIWGDKKGRVSVLFGTILLYSLSNIANSFVTTIPAYAAARFFTGLGLAGEIGAGVTLVSELLPKQTRGYGTTVVLGCGLMGPVVAGYVAEALDWHMAYIAGGILGLLLLLLRVSVSESGMFNSVKDQAYVTRGNFKILFKNRKRFLRYISCIACAVPIWFVVGILVIFSPELGIALGISEPLKATTSTITYYITLTLGGFISGLLSQIFGNRKTIIVSFILGTAATSAFVLFTTGLSPIAFYGLIGLAGFFCGYWTLFMTTTAEQFGTNIRATATTTVPNFVRGSIILDTSLIAALKPHVGFLCSVQTVCALCFIIALLALWKLPESFGRDLDFIEQ